jgi:hypothetical protein
MSFFRNEIESEEGRNIKVLIEKLFKFNEDETIDALFIQKQTIVGYVIISGLYDKFEELVISLYHAKKDMNASVMVDCDKKPQNSVFNRDSKSQNRYLKELNIYKVVESFVANNDVDVDLYTEYMEKNITYEGVNPKEEDNKKKKKKTYDKTTVVTEISKFIYHVICTVNVHVLEYILRYYYLRVLKSDLIQRYKRIISYDENDEQISHFFGQVDTYKPFIYTTTNYRKKNGKMYNFATCGETTLLNLMNYLLLKKGGRFEAYEHYNFSPELKAFYMKYDTMEKQQVDERETLYDWLSVVSNLEDTSFFNFTSNSIYDSRGGDIIPNYNNITIVLQKILGETEGEGDISSLLKKVNENVDIEIDYKNRNHVVIRLNNILEFSLSSEHAETYILTNDEDGFPVIEYPHYLGDYYALIKSRHDNDSLDDQSIYLHNRIEEGGLRPVYKDYIKTMKEFWLYKVNVVNEVPNYIQYMTNLEKLQLTNCSIREIPSFLGQLKKLKLLNLRDNSIKTVDLSGGVFQELEVLVLKHNKIKSIKFDDVLLLLPKIKVLNLAENNLESVPPFIYTLNANTEMYFSRNPISNEEKERLESKFKTVIL